MCLESVRNQDMRPGPVTGSVWIQEQFQYWYGFGISSRIDMGSGSVPKQIWVQEHFMDRKGFTTSSKTDMDSESVPGATWVRNQFLIQCESRISYREERAKYLCVIALFLYKNCVQTTFNVTKHIRLSLRLLFTIFFFKPFLCVLLS